MSDLRELINSVYDDKGNFDLHRLNDQIKIKYQEYLKNRPGFFAPYASAKDFGLTLAEPFFAPVALGLVSGLLVVGAAAAAVVCVGSLFVAGFCALAGKKDTRNAALSFAAISATITLVAPLVSILAAIAAVISAPVGLARLVTRSGATVVDSIKNRMSKNPETGEKLQTFEQPPSIPALAPSGI